MKVISKKQELRDVTITHVSYVKRGANRKTFLMSKSEEKNPDVEFDVRVIKDDNSVQKLLYGIVYEPDTVDAHGDLMSMAEIEKTAHEFNVRYRNIDSEHNLMAGAGEVVESYIAPCDLNINESPVKKGSWVLVTKATDEIWQDYINGDITGYSMFGIARKTIAKEEEATEISWLQKFLEKLGIVKTFEETMSAHWDLMKRDPGFILYMMEEDWYNNVSWDSQPEEKLEKLAKSMLEASNYINGLLQVSVLKSEEQNQVVDGDKDVVITKEPEASEKTETTEDVVIESTEKAVEAEEVVVEKTEPEINPEIEALKQEVEAKNLEVEAKNLELSELKKQYDKLAVQSSVASPANPVQIMQTPRPKLL